MGRAEELFIALNNISTAFIEDSNPAKNSKKQQLNITRILIYAACFIMLVLLMVNMALAASDEESYSSDFLIFDSVQTTTVCESSHSCGANTTYFPIIFEEKA
jgi:hypothetical protein